MNAVEAVTFPLIGVLGFWFDLSIIGEILPTDFLGDYGDEYALIDLASLTS